jgi:N-acetylmuramoyl-L-alanine amidase
MKLLFFFILILGLNAFSQTNFEIVTSKGTIKIPSLTKDGITFIPVKSFADVLNINYYFNSDNKKIELKFSKYNLKITGKNPFIVKVDKYTYSRNVYQMPLDAGYIDDDIYIPVVYSIDIINSASGLKMILEKPQRLIIEDGSVEPVVVEDKKEPSGLFDITGISIDEKANGTLIRIKSGKRIQSYNSSFKNGELKLVFRKVTVDQSTINKTNGTGLVKKITASNINGDAEFILNVGEDYSTSEVLNADKGNDILVTIHNKVFANKDEITKFKEKWSFDSIVIDAGHGGKDAGAIGVNGVKEKDVNLGIALKLGKLIEKNLDSVKVIYTRSKDNFIELFKRGKIANDKNGKLFISIHCNSTEKKPTDANGFEVYLLRPGRTQEAIEIAERENSVIQYEENPERYQKLTDENFILVSMAHSAYMKYSEKFADLLNTQFKNNLELASRGVKQAGFYVLVGASMPSVLVETGFLSNKRDAEYLKSTAGQTKIAESILQAIKNFKTHYESIVNSEF